LERRAPSGFANGVMENGGQDLGRSERSFIVSS